MPATGVVPAMRVIHAPVEQVVSTGVTPELLLAPGLAPIAGVTVVTDPWERSKNSSPPAIPASTSRPTTAMMIHLAAEPRLAFGAGETGCCTLSSSLNPEGTLASASVSSASSTSGALPSDCSLSAECASPCVLNSATSSGRSRACSSPCVLSSATSSA